MSCGLRVLWSDGRISRQISPYMFQLIRSSEPAGSIDDSWHLVLRPIGWFHLLIYSPPTNRSRIATRRNAPHVHNSSLVFELRNVDGIASSTSLLTARTGRKRYFSLLRCHLKRLPSQDVKTATVKNGTERGHWKEKRDREVTRKAEATSSDSTLD